MKIILISGLAGSGKDAAARFMKERLTEMGKSVVITHFADDLKRMCHNWLGTSYKKSNKSRGDWQFVGQSIRDEFQEKFFVNRVIEEIQAMSLVTGEKDYVIIPDWRYPNECSSIKLKFLFDNVRVKTIGISSNYGNGVLTEEQREHPSETSLYNVNPNYHVYNSRDLDDFHKQLAGIIDDLEGV